MRILVIFASPNKEGHTSALLDSFSAVLSSDCIVTRLDLYSVLPRPCTGCGLCGRTDGCAFGDLAEADAALRAADAVIYAFPVYNYSVPAPLKAFLDRTQRYYEAVHIRRERPFGDKKRPCVILTSCGRDAEESMPFIEKQLRAVCSITGCRLLGCVCASDTDTKPVSENTLRQASDLAKKLLSEP